MRGVINRRIRYATNGQVNAQKDEMNCILEDNSIETITEPAVAPNAPVIQTTLTHTIGVFSDARIPSYIRDFLAADKPEDTSTLEIAYVILLLSHKACDHEVTFSHTELARRLGCKDGRTIRDAEDNLIKRGWITVTARVGLSKLTSVNLDKLPMTTAALPRKPSEAALRITNNYIGVLIDLRQKRRDPLPKIPHKKQWATMAWTAQKIINRSDGDPKLAAKKITFAVYDPTLKKYARQGLYRLWRRWAHVEKAFAEKQEREKGGMNQ
jgi:hypothetical protein